MYYRRKILLALLQVFDNSLEKLPLQKYLFLVTRFQSDKSYDFVPYKYGCYSFQATSDIGTLIKYDKIREDELIYANISGEDYLKELKPADKSAILKVKSVYGSKSNDELMRSTYLSHPYYAINSVIAQRLLSPEQFAKIKQSRPIKDKTILFTIGYEGRSLEEYLNKLIINDVRVLCDVRNNALSMKFGFSKSTLQKACLSVGIKYIHIPEVGIKSEKRQKLQTQSDYNKLFADYKNTTLVTTLHSQLDILSLLIENKRIALTCFEENVCQCHRKPLAEAITALPEWDFELKHL